MASAQPSLEAMKSYKMLSVSTVFLALTAITLCLRIYVRAFMIRSFGWDDWLMVVTWILFAILTGLLLEISILEITASVADEAVLGLIFTFVLCIFGLYIITAIFFKLSLAVFFLRIVNKKWHRMIIVISVAIYSVFGAAWLFVALFQCGSIAGFAANQAAGKCLPFATVLRPLNYLHGTLNAVTDWIFAIVPILMIRGVQMKKQAKVTVCTILVLGVLGSICSIVRLWYVDVIGVLIDGLLTYAPAYAIVSVIELGIGITAANLATLRPLFNAFIDKARTGVSVSKSKGNNNTNEATRLGGSKGVSGSYISSDQHHAGLSDKDDGVVTVTKELQVSVGDTRSDLDYVELQHLYSTRGQHRKNQSSQESLLPV